MHGLGRGAGNAGGVERDHLVVVGALGRRRVGERGLGGHADARRVPVDLVARCDERRGGRGLPAELRRGAAVGRRREGARGALGRVVAADRERGGDDLVGGARHVVEGVDGVGGDRVVGSAGVREGACGQGGDIAADRGISAVDVVVIEAGGVVGRRGPDDRGCSRDEREAAENRLRRGNGVVGERARRGADVAGEIRCRARDHVVALSGWGPRTRDRAARARAGRAEGHRKRASRRCGERNGRAIQDRVRRGRCEGHDRRGAIDRDGRAVSRGYEVGRRDERRDDHAVHAVRTDRHGCRARDDDCGHRGYDENGTRADTVREVVRRSRDRRPRDREVGRVGAVRSQCCSRRHRDDRRRRSRSTGSEGQCRRANGEQCCESSSIPRHFLRTPGRLRAIPT